MMVHWDHNIKIYKYLYIATECFTKYILLRALLEVDTRLLRLILVIAPPIIFEYERFNPSVPQRRVAISSCKDNWNIASARYK